MHGTGWYTIAIDAPTDYDDYRTSSVAIETIDPSQMNAPVTASVVCEGTVRLYREFSNVAGPDMGLAGPPSYPGSAIDPSEPRSEPTIGALSAKNGKRRTSSVSKPPPTSADVTSEAMVAIVAIPNYFTAADLTQFIGPGHLPFVNHLRILKSPRPNRFLALLKFSDHAHSDKFRECFDGKQFNSMEPERCHVIPIKRVEVDPEVARMQADARENLIPFLVDDSDDPSNTKVELPTCPVCLERLDVAVTGLVTIPCQHTFHCSCLSKWRDDTCPICRYSANFGNHQVRQQIQNLGESTNALQIGSSRRESSSGGSAAFRRLTETQRAPRPAASTSSGALSSQLPQESVETCFDCEAQTDLWICLVCGNVGCSRYAPHRHSLEHFIATGHCFAMELNTSRVWDYAGDTYVHRLVTNGADGKLVELPDKDQPGQPTPGAKTASEKADAVGFEYSQLLISQLASQREHYEQLLSSQGDSKAVDTLKSRLKSKEDRLQELARSLNTTNVINDALSEKVDYLTKQNGELREQVEAAVAQTKSLEEQVSDLMFFLDSQQKFKDQPEEVREGTVVIQPSPSAKRKAKKKK
ncbi:RING finger protein Etp1p [Diutina catenulata]